MHQQESQPAPPTLFDATVSDTAQTPTHFSVSVTERKTSIPVSSQATPALQDSGYDSPYAFASPFHVSVAAPEKVGDNIINSHVVYAIQVKVSSLSCTHSLSACTVVLTLLVISDKLAAVSFFFFHCTKKVQWFCVVEGTTCRAQQGLSHPSFAWESYFEYVILWKHSSLCYHNIMSGHAILPHSLFIFFWLTRLFTLPSACRIWCARTRRSVQCWIHGIPTTGAGEISCSCCSPSCVGFTQNFTDLVRSRIVRGTHTYLSVGLPPFCTHLSLLSSPTLGSITLLLFFPSFHVLSSLQAFKTKEELSTAASSTSAPSSSSGSSTSSGSSSGRGFLSFLGSTVESISHTLQTSAGSGSGSGGSGSQHSGEPDQWFDAKKNYINALEIHLNSLLKAINSMIKKRKGEP